MSRNPHAVIVCNRVLSCVYGDHKICGEGIKMKSGITRKSTFETLAVNKRLDRFLMYMQPNKYDTLLNITE